MNKIHAKWRDVNGYEGIYEVSDKGIVRTKEGKTTTNARHGVRHWKQRELKDKTPNGRDVRVSLWKDGKSKDFLVHRLVAIAFLEKTEERNCVNHIDGNPKNNNLENLEWCTHKENQNHAFQNGLAHTNQEITLMNSSTGESKDFISMAEASRFLNRNNGYISLLLKKGRERVGEYEIKVKGVSISGNKTPVIHK